MATKADAVKNLALSKIGCPYVMGGTGKECTVAYRTARANQYPDSAARIRANCQQMKGSKTTCHGCKWYDEEAGHGKPCYDCAQLNLAVMAAAGIPLVSGANSQWLKTVWSECGTIDNLPKDKVCCVFREDDDGKKHHVAVYLGDGTVVHARGHDFGVVRQPVSEVKLTHYGVPAGLYDDGLPTVRKGNRGEYVLLLQKALNNAGIAIETDGKFGSNTQKAVKAFQQAHGLGADGICGPKTWAALTPYLPEREIDPEPSPAPEPDPDEGSEEMDDIVERMDKAREELASLQKLLLNAMTNLDKIFTIMDGGK